MILAVPAFLAVTTPFASTLATPALLLVYFAVPVTPVALTFTVALEVVPFT